MRFVFLSYNYVPDISSPEDWVSRIQPYVGSLERLAEANTVIRVDQINYKGEFTYNGVHYHFVKKANKFFPRSLNLFVRKLKPDVVVVAGLHYPLRVMQLRMRLGSKCRIIAQNHAEHPFSGIKKFLQQIADRSIDAYLFSAYAMGLNWVKSGNLKDPEKIHEVMEVSSAFTVVDKEIAQKKTGISGEPVYLWVGRLNQNKSPLTVVNAFLKFVNSNPAARLFMIYQTGEYLAEIRELTKNSDAIKLVGKVNHNDLLYWYNSADFFISASFYEGSGTAACEAMSCGCVPVLTDIPSFQMMTSQGSCGMLYEAGNEEALLSCLQKSTLMDMTEMKENTLAQFYKKLSFNAIAKRFQEVASMLTKDH